MAIDIDDIKKGEITSKSIRGLSIYNVPAPFIKKYITERHCFLNITVYIADEIVNAYREELLKGESGLVFNEDWR